MKKLLIIAMILLVALSVFVACSKTTAEDDFDTEPVDIPTDNVPAYPIEIGDEHYNVITDNIADFGWKEGVPDVYGIYRDKESLLQQLIDIGFDSNSKMCAMISDYSDDFFETKSLIYIRKNMTTLDPRRIWSIVREGVALKVYYGLAFGNVRECVMTVNSYLIEIDNKCVMGVKDVELVGPKSIEAAAFDIVVEDSNSVGWRFDAPLEDVGIFNKKEVLLDKLYSLGYTPESAIYKKVKQYGYDLFETKSLVLIRKDIYGNDTRPIDCIAKIDNTLVILYEDSTNNIDSTEKSVNLYLIEIDNNVVGNTKKVVFAHNSEKLIDKNSYAVAFEENFCDESLVKEYVAKVYNDKETLLAKLEELNYQSDSGIYKKAAEYDDGFFETKSLVFVKLGMPCVDFRPVKMMYNDGEYLRIFLEDCKIITLDTATSINHYLIEVDNDAIEGLKGVLINIVLV